MLKSEAIHLDSTVEQLHDPFRATHQPAAPTHDRRHDVAQALAENPDRYLRGVIDFTRFLKRSPDTATAEDLRRYQLHLVEQGIASGNLNARITALKFFFGTTLEHPEIITKMRHVYEPRRIPVVLSLDEVTRLLQTAGSLKYQAALGVAYGAGLRASEVVHLTVTDIDSERMVIHVEQGKGKRDRYAMLSPTLLSLTCLVAPCPCAPPDTARRLVVSWPEPGEPAINPTTQSSLSYGACGCRDRQARIASFPASRLCHRFA